MRLAFNRATALPALFLTKGFPLKGPDTHSTVVPATGTQDRKVPCDTPFQPSPLAGTEPFRGLLHFFLLPEVSLWISSRLLWWNKVNTPRPAMCGVSPSISGTDWSCCPGIAGKRRMSPKPGTLIGHFPTPHPHPTPALQLLVF